MSSIDQPGSLLEDFRVVETEAPTEPARERWWGLAFGDGLIKTYCLPESGQVSIGRSPNCELSIEHPSIACQHAVLHIGSGLALEDLGSATGTRVLEAAVPPGQRVPFQAGEVVELGAVMLIISRRPAPIHLQWLWSHDYFESRLHEACGRAECGSGDLALLKFSAAGGLLPARVKDLLPRLLGPEEIAACCAPGEYELLVRRPPADAERLGRRLSAALRGEVRRLRIGIACFSADGRDSEALFARAGERLRDQHAAYEPVDPLMLAEGKMRKLQSLVERVAGGGINVLILGETGVGKEVLARQIHRLSPRANKPLLRLNCAALSSTLLESELFGHERGAFTGAVQAKPGLLEAAAGGTVLLDEVGELPISIQVKLLRVLEDPEVMRVGGLKPRAIDVRFLAATNRDLEAEVARGTFRQDLFYRLCGVTLVVPPLRERVSEITGLAQSFVAEACRQAHRANLPSISLEALRLLQHYPWPGNIRELRNMMAWATLLCCDGSIAPEHLPSEKIRAAIAQSTDLAHVSMPHHENGFHAQLESGNRLSPASDSESGPPLRQATPLGRPLNGFEREPTSRRKADAPRIVEALRQCGGNQTKAAKLLGVSRRYLIDRLDDYGLPRPRKLLAGRD